MSVAACRYLCHPVRQDPPPRSPHSLLLSPPSPQDRVRIEAEALGEEAAVCPAHVPAVYLYDAPMHLIAMRYLAPPFLILRRGLIAGEVYPKLAGRQGHG